MLHRFWRFKRRASHSGRGDRCGGTSTGVGPFNQRTSVIPRFSKDSHSRRPSALVVGNVLVALRQYIAGHGRLRNLLLEDLDFQGAGEV